MDHDFSEVSPPAAEAPPAPAPRPARYDFELPSDTTVSDMLALQLAECVRIARSLSDQATNPRLDDLERLRTVQTLQNLVESSGDLAECIDRLQGGFGWRDQPQPRKKVRKS